VSPKQQSAVDEHGPRDPTQDAAQLPTPLHAAEQQSAALEHVAPSSPQALPSTPPSWLQQGTGWPQLSAHVGLHATATGVQHVPRSQTSVAAQAHCTTLPQPSLTDTAHALPHGSGFGVQHVPASGSHTPPPEHMPLAPQVTG